MLIILKEVWGENYNLGPILVSSEWWSDRIGEEL